MTITVFKDSKFPTSILSIKGTYVADELSVDLTKTDKLSPLFVWIPGNPGLLEYYEEFLKLLHVKNPEWDILGISHAGMSSGNSNLKENECSVYTLDEQIHHKIEIINKFAAYGRELIVMGHSVGAFMAQKVVMSNKLEGKVKKIGLLMPTVIDIHLSEKGTQISTILNWIPNLPQLAGWVSEKIFGGFLPITLVKFIISFFMELNNENKAAHATYTFLKDSNFVEQSLGLAKYEMQIIRHDWEFQRELVKMCNVNQIELWTLFAESDHWVSNQTRSELIELYRNSVNSDYYSYSITDQVPHAFVIKNSCHVVDNYF
ncbi:hypothetical protein TPHA_0D04220 [Tetrapisispora phaffii CBS 4417]|uniref:AB hydrolase-1 domain-containing protein n=1 Tax=Tetrapisispora phaffii (strain ATCC 24235 / CBS 4417 / NBRC 1672 / NRRL Y-8282 / UCD 70-5) TaxID=1071381 RepID=G8BRY1_TETPH|nr:hypothetical protein TPHA_0D04220 [Tetrapisispora phaffii CBS 4417]CCE63056.1 hypothetical protein TPHA_0D04220 [Tetrapisispora phaffii CBS 4417]